MPPMFDLAGGIIIFYLTLLGAVLLVGIVAVETIVLRLMGWKPLSKAFAASVLANAASTIVGVLLAQVIDVFTWWGFLVCFVGSVLIEGLVLAGLAKRSSPAVWRAAVVANIVSYIGLALFLVWFE
jgi:hypothetical protein